MAKKPATTAPKAAAAPAAPADWVYDQRGLGPLERLLLLAVVDHADGDGWFRGCLDELAVWTGLDPAAVEHIRLDLISRGLLAYTDEPEDAPARECTSYWCTPEMRAEHPQRIRLGDPPAVGPSTE